MTGQTGNKPLFNNQQGAQNPQTNPQTNVQTNTPSNQANQGPTNLFNNQSKPAENTGQQNPT